ncbi:hypothetical protein [Gimesia chilikensis]|uniref:hypothetical protein n=1 Tax=Gimesia chilikensis TaxID=2605989 RepID=UPI00118CE217|nr:hypothetical protein [Gimesia chilikensis]QDT84599.1 hypothetical protein MalM14_22590 [Gimesia chilikensis]
MNDLDLSIEEIQKAVEYAHNGGENVDPAILARALECLALCMLRLKVVSEHGEIPLQGRPVDEWYDIFGQNPRSYAAQLQTPATILCSIVGIEKQ